MQKNKAFTLVEIAVVFGLILLTALMVIPNLIEDNKKLDIISKWKHSYQNVEYVFQAINTQITDTDKIAFKNAKSSKEKEILLYNLLNPYFRMKQAVDVKNYKTYYLDGSSVKEGEDYYITNLHVTNAGKIVGVKWLNDNVNNQAIPFAMLSVDLNGQSKPNKWGYDIFAVNIFTDRIEPIGKTDDNYLLKLDCSKKGKGLACSYYYYIYGGKL